jgi:hypothetical protein
MTGKRWLISPPHSLVSHNNTQNGASATKPGSRELAKGAKGETTTTYSAFPESMDAPKLPTDIRALARSVNVREVAASASSPRIPNSLGESTAGAKNRRKRKPDTTVNAVSSDSAGFFRASSCRNLKTRRMRDGQRSTDEKMDSKIMFRYLR